MTPSTMNNCLINSNLNQQKPPQQQHNHLLCVSNSNNNHPIITSTTNMENVNQIFLNNIPSYTYNSIPSSHFDCNGLQNNGNLCVLPPSVSNISGQHNIMQCQQSYNILPQQQQQQILIIAANGLNDLLPPTLMLDNNQNNVNLNQSHFNWNTITNFNMNNNNEYYLSRNSQSHTNVAVHTANEMHRKRVDIFISLIPRTNQL